MFDRNLHVPLIQAKKKLYTFSNHFAFDGALLDGRKKLNNFAQLFCNVLALVFFKHYSRSKLVVIFFAIFRF